MPRITVDTSVPATPVEVAPTQQPQPVQTAANQPEPSVPAPSPSQPSESQPIAEEPKMQLDVEALKKSGSSMLSAFSVRPSGVSFGEAEEGEEILLLLRAHLITNVPWLVATLLLLIVPLILVPLVAGAGSGLGIGAGTGLVFVFFWYAGTLTYAFIHFLYWYFNVYIVTNERIIDVDWYSIVIRKVSTTQIAKLQDVNAVQVGALQGIFDYGNVQIETAAEEENFEFENVPHPQLVAKQINELMQTEEGEGEDHGP